MAVRRNALYFVNRAIYPCVMMSGEATTTTLPPAARDSLAPAAVQRVRVENFLNLSPRPPSPT